MTTPRVFLICVLAFAFGLVACEQEETATTLDGATGKLDLKVKADGPAPDKKKKKPDAKVKADGSAPDKKKKKPDAKPAPDLKAPDMMKGDLKNPKACGVATHPYAGALCGPSSAPCKVKVQQKIPTTTGMRNGQPGLALDKAGNPAVLFSLASSGYKGYLAMRSKSGTWTVKGTPFAHAGGGLAREPSGSLLALAYPGTAKGGMLWRHASGAWKKVADVTPAAAGFSKGIPSGAMGLAVDQGGCAHMAIWDMSKKLAYLRRSAAGKWTTATLTGADAGAYMALALSPSGLPHLGNWVSNPSSGWDLAWHIPGTSANGKANKQATKSISVRSIGLVVTGGGNGEPHLLYSRWDGTRGHMIYAHRAGGGWKHKTVFSDGVSPCGKCTVGASCKFDYSEYRPMALVASGNGQVRLLHQRKHYWGTKVGKKSPYGSSCYWSGGQYTANVDLAWPSSSGFKKATLIKDLLVNWNGSIEAELDAKGDAHAAFYASPQGLTSSLEVRYLKFGK